MSEQEKESEQEGELTEHQKRNVDRYHLLALAFGYNELAKAAPTLGEKVYCRLCRDRSREAYEKLGGKLEYREAEDDLVFALEGDERIYVRFKAADIEQMRKAVAEHDAKTAKASP